MAKDMHTGMRTQIENEVRDRMMTLLSERGFIIDAVLMKRIVLPSTLTQAIEEKLSAEQEAQRMQFVLEREGLEAERKRMEAEGTRDAQRIVSEGLTPEVLRYEYIDALRKLATSENAKIILTNGSDQPLLLDAE